MKPNKLHFPFFLPALVLLLFFSCRPKELTSKEDNVGTSLIDKGDSYHNNKKEDSAFYYYNEAATLSKSNDNKVRALIRLANLQLTQCDFIEAEISITEAIKINKNPIYDYYICNTLGIAYEEQYNFDAAIENYNKSYRSGQTLIERLTVKNNIGVVYLEKKDFNQARVVLESAMANDSLKNNSLIYAKIADNLGYVFFKLNDPKAYDLLNESQRIRDSLKDDTELIASYIHLSEYYQVSNPTLALQMAQKAYQSAKAVNSPDDKIEAIKFWIANADTSQIKKLALEQQAISDSINRVRQTTKNQFANIKYNSRKAIKEKKRAEQRTNNITAVLISVTLLLLIIIYLVRYINRQKLKASVYNTETRISKKIHDELANDIFNSLTFAETQDLQDREKKELFLQGIEKIYNKARNISNENNEIETDKGFETFLKAMITSYNSEQVTILIKDNKEIVWNSLNEHKKVAIYRVLQELLVNMKKYSKCRFAVISFKKDGNTIEILYSDNGIGIADGLIKKNGLQNAETRIKAIKGTITFETGTDKGFKAQIKI
jgi:tetratricopeptide (TPR) repeat protein